MYRIAPTPSERDVCQQLALVGWLPTQIPVTPPVRLDGWIQQGKNYTNMIAIDIVKTGVNLYIRDMFKQYNKSASGLYT